MSKKLSTKEEALDDFARRIGFIRLGRERVKKTKGSVSKAQFDRAFEEHRPALLEIFRRFSSHEITVEQVKAETRALFIKPLFADLEKENSEAPNTS